VEQFHSIAQDKGVLKRVEVATKLQKLKAADAVGQFTFAGLVFTMAGKNSMKLAWKTPGPFPIPFFCRQNCYPSSAPTFLYESR
jgi:hypothetical protein